MSLPLVFHPSVEGDIGSARAWYEGQRPGLGERFKTCVDEALDRISDSPEIYAIKRRGVRTCRIPVFPYVVYFRILDTEVDVIAILHGHRHPKVWESRS